MFDKHAVFTAKETYKRNQRYIKSYLFANENLDDAMYCSF